jgi:hypothetical protein
MGFGAATTRVQTTLNFAKTDQTDQQVNSYE